MKLFQRCPICNGCGQVDGSFYYPLGRDTTAYSMLEVCRRCGGTGTIETPDQGAITITADDIRLAADRVKRKNK